MKQWSGPAIQASLWGGESWIWAHNLSRKHCGFRTGDHLYTRNIWWLNSCIKYKLLLLVMGVGSGGCREEYGFCAKGLMLWDTKKTISRFSKAHCDQIRCHCYNTHSWEGPGCPGMGPGQNYWIRYRACKHWIKVYMHKAVTMLIHKNCYWECT